MTKTAWFEAGRAATAATTNKEAIGCVPPSRAPASDGWKCSEANDAVNSSVQARTAAGRAPASPAKNRRGVSLVRRGRRAG